MDSAVIAEKMILVANVLHQKNMLAAADGNISYRISDQEILITPSGVSKAFLKSKDIAVLNLEGKIIHGNPSSEKEMHLTIYRKCPNARAVVHAHPPTAIAWSVANPELKELPSKCLSEVILACGSIPFAPYARPGTPQMGEVLLSFLPKHRALILSRHGAVTWGEDLDEALRGMERIEHSAMILATAKNLGGLSELSTDEIEYLYSLREKIGPRLF